MDRRRPGRVSCTLLLPLSPFASLKTCLLRQTSGRVGPPQATLPTCARRPDVGTKASENYDLPAKKMMGAGARSVFTRIMSITSNIGTLVLRIIQTINDSKTNDEGEIVGDFSLRDNLVSCSKLFFVTTYHAVRTEGPQTLAFECSLESLCVSFCNIMIHLKRNYKTRATAQIIGMATLPALGIGLLRYGMLIPVDHAWHTIAVPSIILSLVWLEVVLLIRSQMKNDGGDQHLLRDLLMKLGEMPISIYRCVDLIQNPDIPWNAQKILLLLGSGPPMLIGACQIGWIVYKAKAYVISKLPEWFTKMPRLFAREEEHEAARRATEADEGGCAEDREAGETAEVGNGLQVPVTMGASQVGWIAYTAGIKFKVIKWFMKIRGVLAAENGQTAGVAMENYGGGDPGQQVAEEGVQVVVERSA